jgi:hypothetical protein
MVAHGLALITKCALDVERLKQQVETSVDTCYAQQAELMLDSELASGLIDQLQRAVDEHVAQGKIQHATALTQVRNRLKRAVLAVGREVAGSEWGVVEEWFDGITGAPAEPAPAPDPPRPAVRRGPAPRPARAAAQASVASPAQATPASESPARPAPAQRRPPLAPRAASPAPRPGASRTAVLACLLGLAGLGWLAAVQLPRSLAHASPALDLDQIGRDGPFTAVDSRHPSLFLTVDPADWAELPVAERTRRLDLLGGMLRRRHFTGATVFDPEQRVVARWLAERGVELPQEAAPTDAVVRSREGEP